MSETLGGKSMNVSMDAANVYREDVYTDRKVGTIRCMTPVNPDGSTDSTRGILFLGETQIMTPMGALPVSFEIPATTLAEGSVAADSAVADWAAEAGLVAGAWGAVGLAAAEKSSCHEITASADM